MNRILNLALMANPVNWVIVILMIAIAGMAIAFIFPPPDAQT
jgi:hypothetical protein